MTDALFVADHAPGSMRPTASAMQCLYIPRARLPQFLPTPYSYALHLVGAVPFPELDSAVLHRGKDLEPCGRRGIAREFGLVALESSDPSFLRCERAEIPAVCWHDARIDGETTVEFKSLSEWDFQQKWMDGPPEAVLGQAHNQLTIDVSLGRVIVVAIIMKFGTIRYEQFEVARDRSTSEMIASETHEFVEDLRAGRMPDYDASAPSYEAWTKIARFNDSVLNLSDDPEAVRRAEAWYQATIDKAAAEKTIEASKHWFAGQVDGAGRIRIDKIDEDLKVQQTSKKGYTVDPTTYVQWNWVKRGG